MNRPAVVMFSFVLASFGVCAGAQDSRPAESYLPAKPLARTNPDYPDRALRLNQEGWVTLSFVVTPDGSVTETMIEDSNGLEYFERAAVASVSKWQYEPARRNGEPVEEAMMQTTIYFQLSGAQGADRAFRQNYTKIVELLQAGDVAAAGAEVDALNAKGTSNLYEDAWLWLLKAAHLDAVKAPDSLPLVHALQRAIGASGPAGAIYLDPERFVSTAHRLYVLHVQRGELGSAVETFERVRDTEGARRAPNYEQALAAMRPTYEQIMASVDTEQVIVVKGRIDEYHYWIGKLLRRSFSLDSVVGRVDTVDIRCKSGTTRVGFTNEEQAWTIPESWGDCRLYVKGEPGATFSLLELPPSYVARDPPAGP
jgi:TonB family protein